VRANVIEVHLSGLLLVARTLVAGRLVTKHQGLVIFSPDN
jgi:hypothetical protein